MKIGPVHIVAGTGLLVSAGIAFLATRTIGPLAMPAFTELREGPLQEHLVTSAELLNEPVYPHSYPVSVAPGITRCISHGFAPKWSVPDPQVMALPSEATW